MGKTFEMWKQEVDEQLNKLVGMVSDDMGDAPYYDMYEDGLSPLRAAKRAIRYQY